MPKKGTHSQPIKRVKRKFVSNQHTLKAKDVEETANLETLITGASCAKIRRADDFSVPVDPLIQYVIVSWACVFGRLSEFVECKSCKSEIQFERTNTQGLGFQLCLSCNCPITKKIYSCPTQLNETKNHRSYEINRKIVFVMRLLGVGIHGINLFCGMMDLCAGLSNHIYYNTIKILSTACQTVFQKTITKAVDEEEEKNAADGKIERNLTVSGDGTWAKRGYKSLLGVITLIGKQTGKIVDLIVKCSYCKSCSVMKKKLNKADFERWYEDHAEDCEANHTGSAGKMEVDGVIEMFRRSLDLHDVRYGEYIGDGDSKTFTHLVENQPYGERYIIHKLECILHVGKRMYKRLKDLKKKITLAKKLQADANKKAAAAEAMTAADTVDKSQATAKIVAGTTDSTDPVASTLTAPATKKRGRKPKVIAVPKNVKKTLPKARPSKKKKSQEADDPKVKLTDKVIREMSIHYSLAIQRNGTSIEEMRKEIMAGFYHKISTNEFPQHENCNLEWCKYMQRTAAGVEYEHPPPIDPEIQDQVKEIYLSLTKEELLERCLGRNNQNNNESYNSCLWQLAPKHLYCGKSVLEIASWISACVFNEGSVTLLMILKALGVRVGRLSMQYCNQTDHFRKKQSARRSTECSKAGRIDKKKKDQAKFDEQEEAEGPLYGPGIAD